MKRETYTECSGVEPFKLLNAVSTFLWKGFNSLEGCVSLADWELWWKLNDHWRCWWLKTEHFQILSWYWKKSNWPLTSVEEIEKHYLLPDYFMINTHLRRVGCVFVILMIFKVVQFGLYENKCVWFDPVSQPGNSMMQRSTREGLGCFWRSF